MSAPVYRLVRGESAPATIPVLDEHQRAAVAHPGGPLLVLAGPGTGKTTTLVEAVVERVARGVPLENTLLVTFSRRAAGELRDRVAARLGGTIREPVARTIHSYAFGVLRMAALRNELPPPRLLGGAEQDIVIRELLAGGDPARWPVALRPALATAGFAAELRDLLMRAVERGLDGPALVELGRVRGRDDWQAAGRFLAEYHGVTVLRDPGGYDPAELIRGALAAFRDDSELLAAERQRRRRIFVDEYQDTDPAQAELIELLADGADELVLVGDPDQSIYAFRGADQSALREVEHRFGRGAPVPTLALRTCRRSGAALLDATRRVAARLPGRAEQRALVASDDLEPGRIQVEVFRSASEEAAFLAGRLRRAYLDGTPWSRMAVLVRATTTTLGPLRRAMITAGVPVAVRGDDIPLAEQPAVAMLLTVLACALDPTALTEDVAEYLLTGPIGGTDSVQLRRLRRLLRFEALAHGGGTTAPDGAPSAAPPAERPPTGAPRADALVPLLLDPLGAELLPDRLAAPVGAVARTLAAARAALADGADTESTLWAIWQATRLARRWESASLLGTTAGASADRDLDAVVRLFDEAAAFTDRLPNAGPALFAEHLRAQQIPGGVFSAAAPEPESVSILTAHSSKGLEWDLVCIAHVQEGTWPDLRRRGTLLGSELLVDVVRGVHAPPDGSFAPQLAEERRLFYVAATRARRDLVVTAVAGDEEQPSRFLDELDPVTAERTPARPQRGVHLNGLVAELRAAACDPSLDKQHRRSAAVELARLAEADVPGADPDQWWGLAALSTDAGVADPDDPVPVSPSTMAAFGDCELKALLSGFGVRDDAAVAASLGSVVHALAEAAPDDQPLAEFERQLDAVWASIDFGASWFAENERIRAGTMLQRLVDWLRDSRAELTRVAVERSFSVEVDDALLAGRVDRLERDAQGRLVVVDLKTGKSKPPADELANHGQLGAYQVAIDRGGFADLDAGPADAAGHAAGSSGGAVLVQLGAGGPIEQWQPPLATADDPDWARAAVAHVAARMRGHEFEAMQNKHCALCAVSSCCPLQVQGRQVPS